METTTTFGEAIRQARALFEGGAVGGLTDRELLDRFARRGGEVGESAFGAIVARHGPAVLRACRAILGDEHDAHDAFQATFLVLARKAGSLRAGDSLAPWLHEVARRVAAGARASAARRGRHERIAAERAGSSTMPPDVDDLAPILHEELGRLPDRFRAAVLLCDLGGLTHEQAAAQLGWPLGTVRSRLARARERLRGRLTRRGLAPSAIPAAALSPLADSSIEATARLASGGKASLSVVLLTEGGLRAMRSIRWKLAVAATIAVGLAATGAGALARRPAVDDPPTKKSPTKAGPVAAKDDPPASPHVVVESSPSKTKFWAYSPQPRSWSTYKCPPGVTANVAQTAPGIVPYSLYFAGETIPEVAVFDPRTGTWPRQTLKEPARKHCGPYYSTRYVVYHVGRTLYGFSAETGRWAVRDLPEDRFAINVEPGQPIPEEILPPSPDHPLFGAYFGGTFMGPGPKKVDKIALRNLIYKLDPDKKAWFHEKETGLGFGGMAGMAGMDHHESGLPFGDFVIYRGNDVAIIRVGRFLCGFCVRTGTWDLFDLGESKEERALRGYQSAGDMVLIPRGERLFTFSPKTGRFQDVEAGEGP